MLTAVEVAEDDDIVVHLSYVFYGSYDASEVKQTIFDADYDVVAHTMVEPAGGKLPVKVYETNEIVFKFTPTKIGKYTFLISAKDSNAENEKAHRNLPVDSLATCWFRPTIDVLPVENQPVGGVAPIRIRYTVHEDIPSDSWIKLKAREDVEGLEGHPAVDWVEINPALINPIEISRSTVGRITTITEEWYWDTISVHNGNHTVRGELILNGDPNQVVASDQETVEVKNLIVSASPDVQKYSPDAGTGCTIDYNLADGCRCEAAQQTTVQVNIYSSDQTLIRTDEFVKTAGSSYTYTWDGKDSEGKLRPKGIYLYKITASQSADCDEPIDYWHFDSDCEKSSWTLTTGLDISNMDRETNAATVEMKFTIGNADPSLTASSAKVDVYNPDLELVGHQDWNVGEQGAIPVGQENIFAPFNVEFSKSGDYTFLVSVDDGMAATDRAHRNKPLLQCNKKKTTRKLAVMLDPGHGKYKNLSDQICWRRPWIQDPDGILGELNECNSVLDIAQRVSSQISGQKHIEAVKMTRYDEWDIGPNDKTGATSSYKAANLERVKRAKEFVNKYFDYEAVFVSIHTNAGGEGNYTSHGTDEVVLSGATSLGAYILAMLTANDPTLTQLKYLGPWVQGNMVLNGIAAFPNDPARRLRPIPATLQEVAFGTNWNKASDQPSDYWLEARRLRNDATSGNADFLDRVTICFDDGLWFYWAIETNGLAKRSDYCWLDSFTHWP